MFRFCQMMRGASLIVTVAWAAAPAAALDRVSLVRDGKKIELAGKIEVQAEDGGLLLLAPDGLLWAIKPDEINARSDDQQPFEPLTREALGRQLLSELPEGFETHITAHYVICYNTSREYASWCGALFERLYRGFTNYWTRKGLKLHDPEFPLAAIVFGDRDAYVKFAAPELGKGVDSIIGYYSLRTNRVTMYDLTGLDALRSPGDRRGSSAQINAILSRPQAEPTVATIIHEATHQIAFNSGLQTRFADIPLWVSEGIAVYFETPDLQTAKGWRTVGAVNRNRLDRFRENLPQRPADSLRGLLADDKRMRDTRTAIDAYAEAWALNYYLIRQHPKQYVAYLKRLSEKPPLVWDDPETRLKEFQEAFGEGFERIDSDFLRQMQKVQ